MNIRNDELFSLGNFLADLTLKGASSRFRTRFIKKLQKQMDLVEEEKIEIIRTHGELDENGHVKTTLENGNEIYVIHDREACEKEIMELFQEDFIIEESLENRQMLLSVRDALLNCDKEFTGHEAFIYDSYCEKFENLTYDKELAL
jgi:hypothetical protein